MRHHLIVRPKGRTAVLHTRDEAGTITSCIISDGAVALGPPGIVVRGLFG